MDLREQPSSDGTFGHASAYGENSLLSTIRKQRDDKDARRGERPHLSSGKAKQVSSEGHPPSRTPAGNRGPQPTQKGKGDTFKGKGKEGMTGRGPGGLPVRQGAAVGPSRFRLLQTGGFKLRRSSPTTHAGTSGADCASSQSARVVTSAQAAAKKMSHTTNADAVKHLSERNILSDSCSSAEQLPEGFP